MKKEFNVKPENLTELWNGEIASFSWEDFVTAEKAVTVNAPRIKECFLNIECTLLWEHELFENSGHMTVALKAMHICMDSDHYDENILGRYGKTGYMYNINSPKNSDTGENFPECFGALELYK